MIRVFEFRAHNCLCFSIKCNVCVFQEPHNCFFSVVYAGIYRFLVKSSLVTACQRIDAIRKGEICCGMQMLNHIVAG